MNHEIIEACEDIGAAGHHPADRDRVALARYLDRLSGVKILTHAEELELSRRACAGDDEAAKKLAEANLRFVVHIAKCYSGRGTPIRELIAAGNLGLMRAIDTYRGREDARFAAYAIWWIRRHVIRALIGESRITHVPAHRHAHIARIAECRAVLSDRLWRTPSSSEVAREAQLPVQLVLSLEATAFRAVSLDAPVGAGESGGMTPLRDILEDASACCPGGACERRDLLDGMNHLLTALPPRHAAILREAYGLESGVPLSNEDVGKKFNLTRERVRQIRDEAVRLLRRNFREEMRPMSREEMKESRMRDAIDEVWRTFREETRERKSPGVATAA